MTVTTISRHRAARDDLAGQGLWDFYDDLERLGYDVGTVDQPVTDRHLLITTRDGGAWKITGYGKDDLTLRRYATERDYEYDDASHAEAHLTETDVLAALDGHRDLLAA